MTIPLPSATELPALAAALDSASHDERLAWMRSLGKRELVALYAAAEGGAVGVDQFHAGPGEVLINYGQNSLPLFNQFQKRVVANGEQVQGYNHQSMAWLTGPGHFVLRASPDVEGEVWFDYTGIPTAGFDEFPALSPNDSGLSRFVYAGMIDIVRRVSREVTIGAALKKGKMTGDYFALCRTRREAE